MSRKPQLPLPSKQGFPRANPPGLYRCPDCGELLSGPPDAYRCPGGAPTTEDQN